MKHFLMTENLASGDDAHDGEYVCRATNPRLIMIAWCKHHNVDFDQYDDELDDCYFETNSGGIFSLTGIKEISKEDFDILFKYFAEYPIESLIDIEEYCPDCALKLEHKKYCDTVIDEKKYCPECDFEK